MLQQCWLTLQATDFPQQTNGWTVWHEKCLLNAGRHTPPPPPGLNVMVAFLSVASATETHKNCRMCLWPQLLFFGAQQERMTHSFLHGICNDVWLLACCMDHHWNSLGWEGQLFYTVHSSSWGCQKLQKLSRGGRVTMSQDMPCLGVGSEMCLFSLFSLFSTCSPSSFCWHYLGGEYYHVYENIPVAALQPLHARKILHLQASGCKPPFHNEPRPWYSQRLPS